MCPVSFLTAPLLAIFMPVNALGLPPVLKLLEMSSGVEVNGSLTYLNGLHRRYLVGQELPSRFGSPVNSIKVGLL